MFAKVFYNFATMQKCLQNYKSVQKCLQKKFFFCVGGVKIILFSRIVGKFIFVLYSHPLLAMGNRERRVALYCIYLEYCKCTIGRCKAVFCKQYYFVIY